MNKDFEAVIVSACRTPIGSFGGVFKDLSAVDLGAVVVREAICRAKLQPSEVGDVILGCVLQAGAGMNVARQAALKAGVPIEVPAETVNRVCGSGLQSVVHAVEAIRVGYVDTIVAGGTESMSNAPYILKGARWGYRMGNAEAMAALKPAFQSGGTVTAGNASGINDGASALVVTSGAKARERHMPPLARILAYVSTGVDPKIMGIGPVPAVRTVLERAELEIQDIDLFELNEAFAAQSVAVIRELGL